jgi:hypothetical protein
MIFSHHSGIWYMISTVVDLDPVALSWVPITQCLPAREAVATLASAVAMVLAVAAWACAVDVAAACDTIQCTRLGVASTLFSCFPFTTTRFSSFIYATVIIFPMSHVVMQSRPRRHAASGTRFVVWLNNLQQRETFLKMRERCVFV